MKFSFSRFLLSAVAVAAIGWTAPVFASSGVSTDYVENTFITSTTFFAQSPGNYLITLGGHSTICPKSGFAYLLETDSYYSTLQNTIIGARESGKYINVYWTTDANGYCHITNVTVVS